MQCLRYILKILASNFSSFLECMKNGPSFRFHWFDCCHSQVVLNQALHATSLGHPPFLPTDHPEAKHYPGKIIVWPITITAFNMHFYEPYFPIIISSSGRAIRNNVAPPAPHTHTHKHTKEKHSHREAEQHTKVCYENCNHNRKA